MRLNCLGAKLDRWPPELGPEGESRSVGDGDDYITQGRGKSQHKFMGDKRVHSPVSWALDGPSWICRNCLLLEVNTSPLGRAFTFCRCRNRLLRVQLLKNIWGAG